MRACRGRYRSRARPNSADAAPETLSTSAPCSASVRAQVGPASTRVRSSTRMPESGLSPGGSFSGGASPMRSIDKSGCVATAAACGWRRHSSAERTSAAQPPAAWMASSSASPSRVATAAATAARSAPAAQPSTAQRRGAMVREIAVQEHPAAIGARIEPAHRIERLLGRRARDAQIAGAAQRRRGVAQIDGDRLARTAATLTPQLSGRGGRRGDGGGAGGADAERRRQDRIGAGDVDTARRRDRRSAAARRARRASSHQLVAAALVEGTQIGWPRMNALEIAPQLRAVTRRGHRARRLPRPGNSSGCRPR